jgi:NADH-quinone oxidoreductase subunit H
MVSYEVPMALCLISIAIVTESLDLQEISFMQSNLEGSCTNCGESLFFGFKVESLSSLGGFFKWNIIQMPILLFVFAIFFICSLAESNRVPFDLPESESELIGGFHTEYSGFRWAIIMLSEYGMMLLLSLLSVILFFGSWNSPLPDVGGLTFGTWTSGFGHPLWSNFWGIFWLVGKTLVLIFVQIVIRFTYPRLRVDQLMNLSWKYLTPLALLLIFVCAAWKMIL